MIHSMHMIFSVGMRNPLHHNEGRGPHVGSQESSLATQDKTSPKILEKVP